MPSQTKNVLVFCGHLMGNKPSFIKALHYVGQAIAEKGWRLVYGGADEGLMGTVATAAISHGGMVTGIIPGFLLDRERPMTALEQAPHELIKTTTMAERKEMMFRMCDGIITCPGGPGTRDEFWEVVTNKQIGVRHIPHVVLNIGGCFDPLRKDVEQMVEDGFAGPDLLRLQFHDQVDTAISALELAMLRQASNIVGLRTAG